MEEWVRIISHVFLVKDVLWLTTVWSSSQRDLNLVSHFQVTTMAECEEEICVDFEENACSCTLFCCELALDGSCEIRTGKVKSIVVLRVVLIGT